MTDQTVENTFLRVFSSPFLGQHLTVLWHAGEPLVVGIDYYRNALKIMERHRPRELAVTCHIQTNGTLLNQEWIDFFQLNHVKVGLSLDGPADLHNHSRKTRRGHGTFEQTMRGLRILAENNFPFRVITVLTRRSLRSARALFEFYIGNNISDVAFNIEEIEGINKNSSLHSGDAEREFRDFLFEFWDLAETRQPRLAIREFDGAFRAIVDPSSVYYGNPMVEPLRFVAVGVSGEISTFSPELLGHRSHRHSTFVFGNVHDNDLADVFKNLDFLRVNDEIQRGVQACRASCSYFEICRGGVPSNKLFENGTFDSSETLFCRLSKKAVIDVVLERIEQRLALIP